MPQPPQPPLTTTSIINTHFNVHIYNHANRNAWEIKRKGTAITRNGQRISHKELSIPPNYPNCLFYLGLRSHWSRCKPTFGEGRVHPGQVASLSQGTYRNIPPFTYTPTGNLKSSINRSCMSLDCGRKLKNPEGTHPATGRTCKLHTIRPPRIGDQRLTPLAVKWLCYEPRHHRAAPPWERFSPILSHAC